MESAFMQLARLIDKLHEAGVVKGTVALQLTKHGEKKLIGDIFAATGATLKTVNGCEYMGWDVVVVEDL